MNIKSNSVVGSNGSSPVSLPNSISIGSSIINVSGNIQSELVTTTILNTTTVNVTTVNSNRYLGDGSQITGLPSTNARKIIAFKYIFADPPLRA